MLLLCVCVCVCGYCACLCLHICFIPSPFVCTCRTDILLGLAFQSLVACCSTSLSVCPVLFFLLKKCAFTFLWLKRVSNFHPCHLILHLPILTFCFLHVVGASKILHVVIISHVSFCFHCQSGQPGSKIPPHSGNYVVGSRSPNYP